jgi:hypothetical protein
MICVQSFVADFWTEACESMIRNVCGLLRAADEPVTIDNVARVMQHLPSFGGFEDREWQRESFCFACLMKLARKEPTTKELADLADYFAIKVPKLTYVTVQMLQESIAGVLRGVSLDK